MVVGSQRVVWGSTDKEKPCKMAFLGDPSHARHYNRQQECEGEYGL